MALRFSAKNPDYVNQLGFDADLLSANGVLGNGSTSATVSLKSGSDRYYAGAIMFKTEIFVPKFDASNFRKTVLDLNGGSVRPGDVLEYTGLGRNVGTDAALQTVIRDTLGATLTYVAGSLRVSAGANAGTKTDAAGRRPDGLRRSHARHHRTCRRRCQWHHGRPVGRECQHQHRVPRAGHPARPDRDGGREPGGDRVHRRSS
jgi:uncharacterized repeat protein (TIGR01451 family)